MNRYFIISAQFQTNKQVVHTTAACITEDGKFMNQNSFKEQMKEEALSHGLKLEGEVFYHSILEISEKDYEEWGA